MKRFSKSPKKKKFLKNTNDSIMKNNISINNPKNKKYLDNIAYQEYLKKINNESSDFNE